MTLRVACLCLALVVAGCGGGGSEESGLVVQWPRFRGDDLNSGAGLSFANNSGALSPGFPVPLDRGPISAAITIGPTSRIVVATERGAVLARNPDGTPIWEFATGSGVRSTPTIDGNNNVYFGDEAGEVICLNVNGQPLWRFNAGSGAVRSSVLLEFDGVEGLLSAVFFGTSGGSFFAIGGFQSVPGLLWRFDTSGAITSTPSSDGGTLYFASADGKLYGLSRDNVQTFPRPIDVGVTTSGLCHGGTSAGQLCTSDAMCAGGTCDRTTLLLPSPTVGAASSVLQVGAAPAGLRGVVVGVTPAGDEQWRATLPAPVIASPSQLTTAGNNGVVAAHLIVVDQNGAVYALDQGLGAVCVGGDNNGAACLDDFVCGGGTCGGAVFTVGAPVVASPLTGSDGTIVVATAPADGSSATVVALKMRICLSGKAEGRLCRSDFDCPGATSSDPFGACDPAEGQGFVQKRWTYPPADSGVKVGAIRSSPSASTQGTIYVGSDDGNLYALGSGS